MKEECPKKQGKRRKKDPKSVQLRQEAYATLRDHGLGIEKAGDLVGYSPRSSSYLSRSLEAKRKRGLLSPLVPLAKKAVKATLKGQKIGDADLPKASDIIRASELVLDREEPKVQRIEQKSLSLSADLTPAQEARYRRLLGLPKADQAEFDSVDQKNSE